jgi:hypothetical protein
MWVMIKGSKEQGALPLSYPRIRAGDRIRTCNLLLEIAKVLKSLARTSHYSKVLRAILNGIDCRARLFCLVPF